MSVRCVRKAAQKPMSSVAAVTVTVSSSVCHNSVVTSGRPSSRRTESQPGLAGLHHHEHQRAAHDDRDRRGHHDSTNGAPEARRRNAAGLIALRTERGRAARAGAAGLAHESRPTLCSRSSACLPSPRSVAGTDGPAADSGLSSFAAVTPGSSGYS